jgi:hypothetical protein
LQPFAADFITLAEAYFNLNLRVRQMETKVDLTPDGDGVCTLPTDYIEYKRVVELASIRRPLEYITEDADDEYYPTRSAGLACHFMILGDSLTALDISSNDIELTYYQAVPALSAQNTTNWLLAKLPNLYLHTCLMYAAEWLHEDSELARETAFVTRFVELLNSADNRAKFGNAGMTMRGPTP